EERLPEPGPGADQRDHAVLLTLAGLQAHEVRGAESRDAVGDRIEVVDQPRARDADVGREAARVDAPREVRRLAVPADHGARDPEARAVEPSVDGGEKVEHDRREPRELAAPVRARLDDVDLPL